MTSRSVVLQPGLNTGADLRDGVLVLSGYGIRLGVERGHLLVEDGIGLERRRLRFSRLDRELKRMVIIGHTGTITLDAIRWLHGVGVPLVHLNTDGTLYLVAAPSGAIIPTLRRAQALAAETGLGVRLSQELVLAKVENQRQLLSRFPASVQAQETIQDLLQSIAKARRLPDLRRLEAMAARAYWRAWQGFPVRFKAQDAKHCPRHWRTCGTRASALTNSQSPRKGINPANAVLNYLYAILEAEARIAALAVGLDPALGLLHADQRNRDSLAADLMEPVRPVVDAFVMDFLTRHTFTKKDVYELLDGQCRLLPPVTERLASTAPLWARKVLPLAQGLATRLLEFEKDANSARQMLRSTSTSVNKVCRRAQRVVLREYRPRIDPAHDPRRASSAGARRRVAMLRIAKANREWFESQVQSPNPDHFRRTVTPRLQGVPLKELVSVTGLSKGACSLIRSGKVTPHPRHWKSLEDLVRLRREFTRRLD